MSKGSRARQRLGAVMTTYWECPTCKTLVRPKTQKCPKCKGPAYTSRIDPNFKEEAQA